MINVLFFAQLREQLELSSLELTWSPELATVQGLRDFLACYRDNWESFLMAENILCAVNQQQADAADSVADGDEVAFFPPVTGG